MKFQALLLAVLVSAVAAVAAERFNEIEIRDDAVHNSVQRHPLPHTYLKSSDIPDSFSWANVDGVSYLTHSLNQHIPQYCGSCWAHGALSSLADRIKIARKAQGDDINLSIQFILNCGTEMAGSCHGGYHTSTYEFIRRQGYVPYDTCMPYIACSEESTDGICPHVDTQCSATTTCKTCDTFAGMGGKCVEIDMFPNATVAEYGIIPKEDKSNPDYDLVKAIQAEILARGPVAATINAEPIVAYQGGVFTDDTNSQSTNHIVSIVGWGQFTDKDSSTGEDVKKTYWIIRNSWGQYWGELGYVRVEAGKNILGIEGEIAWATPGAFTIHNFPCHEDGKNCDLHDKPAVATQYYVDPSQDLEALQAHLNLVRTSEEKRYVRATA